MFLCSVSAMCNRKTSFWPVLISRYVESVEVICRDRLSITLDMLRLAVSVTYISLFTFYELRWLLADSNYACSSDTTSKIQTFIEAYNLGSNLNRNHLYAFLHFTSKGSFISSSLFMVTQRKKRCMAEFLAFSTSTSSNFKYLNVLEYLDYQVFG